MLGIRKMLLFGVYAACTSADMSVNIKLTHFSVNHRVLLSGDRLHVPELISHQHSSKMKNPFLTERQEPEDEREETLVHSHPSLLSLLSVFLFKPPASFLCPTCGVRAVLSRRSRPESSQTLRCAVAPHRTAHRAEPQSETDAHRRS